MSSRAISYAVLVLGAIATLAALAMSSGNALRGLLSGFTIWTLSPYAVLGAAVAIARTRGSIITALIISLLALASAVCGYGSLFVGHQSSTAALIFVSLPFCQLLAAAIAITFAAERRKHANNI